VLVVGAALVVVVVTMGDDNEPQPAREAAAPAVAGGGPVPSGDSTTSSSSPSRQPLRGAGATPRPDHQPAPSRISPGEAASPPPASPAQAGAAPSAQPAVDAGVATPSPRRDGGTTAAPSEAARRPAAAAPVKVTQTPKPHPVDAGVAAAPDAGVSKKIASDTPRGSASRSDTEDGGNYARVARFLPSGGAVLEGRVVDVDTARPLSGTSVEIRYQDRFVEATTDAAGTFRVPGMVPDARVVVWVGGRRDQRVAERLEITAPAEGKTADIGVIRLLSGDETASKLNGWIGIYITRAGGQVKVSAVNSWTPADRAGIEVGDAVLSVDGREVKGLGPRAVNYLMRGPLGGATTLEVESSNGKRRKVTLERVWR
jgi:hypothetical protein